MAFKNMRRSVKFILRPDNFFSYPILFVKILFKIRNWPKFLIAYMGFYNKPFKVIFYDGTKIDVNSAVDAATVCVVMVKNEYGDLRSKMNVIDIGANIGTFSILAAKNKNSIVYSFEPEKKNYSLLRTNIRNNKLPGNVYLFNLAVAGKTGTTNLYLSEYSAYHSTVRHPETTISVANAISLNDVFKKNKIILCDLLKIDCEGGEFEVLYSASKSTLDKILEIRMEYHNQTTRRDNISNLSRFLGKHGFRLSFLKRNNMRTGNAWFTK